MPYKKGESGNPNGRKKGSLGKFTTLKQAYLDAFNSEEIGGSNGIIEAFKPTNFTKRDFFRLMSKMLPTNVNVEGDLRVTFQASEKFMPKTNNEKK